MMQIFCYLNSKNSGKAKRLQGGRAVFRWVQALSLAKKYQPDIVLLDLNLSSGGLDGIRIGKEIRLQTERKNRDSDCI